MKSVVGTGIVGEIFGSARFRVTAMRSRRDHRLDRITVLFPRHLVTTPPRAVGLSKRRIVGPCYESAAPGRRILRITTCVHPLIAARRSQLVPYFVQYRGSNVKR